MLSHPLQRLQQIALQSDQLLPYQKQGQNLLLNEQLIQINDQESYSVAMPMQNNLMATPYTNLNESVETASLLKSYQNFGRDKFTKRKIVEPTVEVTFSIKDSLSPLLD